MDLLLRFKPWHLFFLLLIPCLFSWFSTFAGIWDSVFFVFYTGWAYTIGLKMNSLLPEAIRPGTKYFKRQYWLLVGITLFAYDILPFTQFFRYGYGYNTLFSAVFLLIFFYLLFSTWMFAARMLESMIEGEIVNRSDSLKAFFCFWFFPIGIFQIQPAVQRVLAKYESNATATNSTV